MKEAVPQGGLQALLVVGPKPLGAGRANWSEMISDGLPRRARKQRPALQGWRSLRVLGKAGMGSDPQKSVFRVSVHANILHRQASQAHSPVLDLREGIPKCEHAAQLRAETDGRAHPRF